MAQTGFLWLPAVWGAIDEGSRFIHNDFVKTPRQSSFELLRILCMLLIIAGHLLGQGGVLRHIALPEPGPGFIPAVALASAGRIATNVFLLLGCWFLVDAPRFRCDRWLRLWALVFCYSAPLTIWMIAIGRVGATAVVKGFLPFFGRPLWFASAWLTLLLLAPFLHGALSLAPRRSAALSATLLLVFSLNATFRDTRAGYFADLPWFPTMYLIMAHLKLKTSFFQRAPRWGCLLAALALYGALVVARLASMRPGASLAVLRAGAFANCWLDDIKSLPNFLCALGVFMFFAKADLGVVPVLNALARPAFAVYVGHQVPAFIPYLWLGICRTPLWWKSSHALGIALLCVIGVYLAFSVIEALRVRLIEPLYTRRAWFAALARRLESAFSDSER